jgi:hypothetical protein
MSFSLDKGKLIVGCSALRNANPGRHRPDRKEDLMQRIAIAAMVLLTTTFAAPANAQVDDHLQCYRVKDPTKLDALVDLDSPQFGLAPDCRIGKTMFFCVPALKTVLSAVDKGTKPPTTITPVPITGPNAGDRICYKARCPFPVQSNNQVTDQFGTRSITRFATTMLCTPAFKGAARFVDNGDGTVTDQYTGLQWEKKVSPGGGPTDPHDVDNLYDWGNLAGCPFTGCPNGLAFSDFLGRLNDCTSDTGSALINTGFAGHCDWRLPTLEELATIADPTVPGCGIGSACIDPVFGPTGIFGFYWSATTYDSLPDFAWNLAFFDATFNNAVKIQHNYVRAVRSVP